MSIDMQTGEGEQFHSDTIHALSERYHVDESTVREIYQSKLQELQDHATITSFLPVLVERHIKSMLGVVQETAA